MSLSRLRLSLWVEYICFTPPCPPRLIIAREKTRWSTKDVTEKVESMNVKRKQKSEEKRSLNFCVIQVGHFLQERRLTSWEKHAFTSDHQMFYSCPRTVGGCRLT